MEIQTLLNVFYGREPIIYLLASLRMYVNYPAIRCDVMSDMWTKAMDNYFV